MKNNIKYIFLDVWETLLFSNKNEQNLNEDRSKIIYRITKTKSVDFWKDEIEKEILRFKQQELKGISITPQKRIERLLAANGLDIKFAKKILDEYDELVIKKYRPTINVKLINELLNKKYEIILISNIGLTTKNVIKEVLKEHNIENSFKDMFFSQDYAYCKPNILFYKIPLELYKIKKDEVLMYGDSKTMDLEPCSKLGIKCIIKKWSEI